jgi:hypothetical protein
VDPVLLSNAVNTDWEAAANDGHDRYFIGDFGNNNNDRTDLRIYIVDSLAGGSFLHADTINFAYPDQVSFPAPANFDMEGMFYFGDSLYLFSRNQLFGGNGFTKLYSIPAHSGTFVANLIDSLYIGVVVTGADLSPDGNTVALMSYGRIVILEGFAGTNFLGGTQRYITIPISQTESVAFLDDSTIYFTNEEGFLFTMTLTEPTSGLITIERCCSSSFDPASGSWTFHFLSKSTFRLTDMTGKLVASGPIEHGTLTLDSHRFGTGAFWLLLSHEGKKHTMKLVLP